MRQGCIAVTAAPSAAEGPLVSLIVPVYNTPVARLCRCVASLLGQDYRNMELIVVDDGSDGPCATALKELRGTDARIRMISGGHKGVSHARNVGIEASRGEWVAFSDADDVVEPCFLSDAVNVALAEGADFVCGFVEPLFKGDEPAAREGAGDYCVVDDSRCLTSAKMQMLGNVKYKYFAGPDYKGRGPVAKLYRKAAMDGLRFDESIAIGEDTLFNYRFIERCSAIVIVDRVWYWYYQYQGSAVHSVTVEPWEASIAGILACCAPGEDRTAFVSRCAFMTGQGIESLVSARGLHGGMDDGVALLAFAGEQGCFSSECYEGYELTRWLALYDRLCKKGRYRCAYLFWGFKKIVKSRLSRYDLIGEEE